MKVKTPEANPAMRYFNRTGCRVTSDLGLSGGLTKTLERGELRTARTARGEGRKNLP